MTFRSKRNRFLLVLFFSVSLIPGSSLDSFAQDVKQNDTKVPVARNACPDSGNTDAVVGLQQDFRILNDHIRMLRADLAKWEPSFTDEMKNISRSLQRGTIDYIIGGAMIITPFLIFLFGVYFAAYQNYWSRYSYLAERWYETIRLYIEHPFFNDANLLEQYERIFNRAQKGVYDSFARNLWGFLNDVWHHQTQFFSGLYGVLVNIGVLRFKGFTEIYRDSIICEKERHGWWLDQDEGCRYFGEGFRNWVRAIDPEDSTNV
jgi:hypothetical protein